MVENLMNYFKGLNSMGQALFVVGVLLIITFIILLITVLKPEKKSKVKKVYGESDITDKETIFEEKMRDISNIMETDINIENDRTKNLKAIVDQLKELESRNNNHMSEIQKYEAEQENTAVISVKELLKIHNDEEDISEYEEKVNYNEPAQYNEPVNYQEQVHEPAHYEEPTRHQEEIEMIEEVKPVEEIKEPSRYIPRQEVFSSVYGVNNRPQVNEPQKTNEQIEQEKFLNSLKEFRNNL
jgi:hypothetical protein